MSDNFKSIQQVQPPKGTRDFLPNAMILRRNIIEKIRKCFELYGFSEIDSPVFEYFELLSRKCGEEIEKEIYTFKDKADRKLGLRFEFTSPLGRYYASNNSKLTKPFKRYIIGKVYRYENTQNGRYREFYQADADIVGVYSMFAELELMDLAVFTLEKLGLNNYEIHLNNRKILDGIIESAGIPADKKEAALRILDKLSKIGENKTVKEFIENGLTEENYKSFINLVNGSNFAEEINAGNYDDGDKENNPNIIFLESLKEKLKNNAQSLEGINELIDIFKNSNKFKIGKYLKFDPLLVRGLGYYTGPIFEIKSLDVNIGSFAAVPKNFRCPRLLRGLRQLLGQITVHSINFRCPRLLRGLRPVRIRCQDVLNFHCSRFSGNLDEAREIIKSYVREYDCERLHAFLN